MAGSPSEPSPQTDLTSLETIKATSTVKAEASTTKPRGRKRTSEPVESPAKRTKRASRGAQPSYAEESEDEEEETVTKTTPKKRSAVPNGKSKAKTEAEAEQNGEAVAEKKSGRKTKAKVKAEPEDAVKEEEQDGEGGTAAKKTPRKRKTKEEKESEMQPLAARTVGSKLFVGAHVSAAGGVQNAVTNSLHIGGNAFALFLKSQRKWQNPAITPEAITTFKQQCHDHNIESDKHVVPHGSYLVNLAHTDPDRATQAYTSFADDLSRCHKLNIQLYNFHPGNAASSTRTAALQQLASQLNRAHKDPSTGSVLTVLETMAVPTGNTIGGTFDELAAIIALIDDKSRVGVCLDTCHVFAAGYDLRTPAAYADTISRFDATVGLAYLKALHVNDSKAPLGSGRDLHANIGTGFLGLRAFHNIMNDERLQGLPMVLETPIDAPDPADAKKTVEDKRVWAREIKLLERLVGMDVEGEEFKGLEAELQERGRAERERVQDQVDRREEKASAKKAASGTKGGRGKKAGATTATTAKTTVKDMFAKAGAKKGKKGESAEEGSDGELS